MLYSPLFTPSVHTSCSPPCAHLHSCLPRARARSTHRAIATGVPPSTPSSWVFFTPTSPVRTAPRSPYRGRGAGEGIRGYLKGSGGGVTNSRRGGDRQHSPGGPAGSIPRLRGLGVAGSDWSGEERGCEILLAEFLQTHPVKTFNMVSHIRYATRGAVRLENVHPFQREMWGISWCFAHNG